MHDGENVRIVWGFDRLVATRGGGPNPAGGWDHDAHDA